MARPTSKLRPGPVIIFGSGETSSSGRKVFEVLLRSLSRPPRIALLETPAGFEPNSDRVIGRVAEFLNHNLQNYVPQVEVIPARRRGTAFSPENPGLVEPLLQADLIFMGPGSPTYAVRQLKDSLAWHYLVARHRLGASIVLASAAAIAISRYTLPVYEIYKVGEDLHWKDGLDLFGPYDLPLVFITHWNNNDGGEELDTSRCFMGQSRFSLLMELLPPGLSVLGVDEKTALILDLRAGICRVIGLGGVTLLHTGHSHPENLGEQELKGMGLAEIARQRESHVHWYKNGTIFPLSECRPMRMPEDAEGLPPQVWEKALATSQTPKPAEAAEPPPEVQILLAERQAARQRKDWATSDALRDRISALGWNVVDTREEQKVEKTD